LGGFGSRVSHKTTAKPSLGQIGPGNLHSNSSLLSNLRYLLALDQRYCSIGLLRSLFLLFYLLSF
jgi:hypothetical protein